jgi:hypothetical protein
MLSYDVSQHVVTCPAEAVADSFGAGGFFSITKTCVAFSRTCENFLRFVLLVVGLFVNVEETTSSDCLQLIQFVLFQTLAFGCRN